MGLHKTKFLSRSIEIIDVRLLDTLFTNFLELPVDDKVFRSTNIEASLRGVNVGLKKAGLHVDMPSIENLIRLRD